MVSALLWIFSNTNMWHFRAIVKHSSMYVKDEGGDEGSDSGSDDSNDN